MKQTLLSLPTLPTPTAPLSASADLLQTDLIFVQPLGLVPRQLVAPSPPATLPATERKWLGTDFSHVIVSL